MTLVTDASAPTTTVVNGVIYDRPHGYLGSYTEGTKVWAVVRCGRCSGSGVVRPWGTCFRCGGNGQDPSPVRLMTAAQRQAADARNASAAQRKQSKRAAAAAAFLATVPDLAPVLTFPLAEGAHHILADMAHKVARYGSLSDKQVALARKIVVDEAARVQRDADRAAATAALVASGVTAPTGRATVEGVVQSVKWYDNDFGSVCKMLVALDDGAKVWGTRPRPQGDEDEDAMIEVGFRVRFTATFEAKADDATFATYKRPTNCTIVAVPAEAVAA
jgi:hypothetical protein